jgi:hypothetical protein
MGIGILPSLPYYHDYREMVLQNGELALVLRKLIEFLDLHQSVAPQFMKYLNVILITKKITWSVPVMANPLYTLELTSLRLNNI